MTEIPSRRTRSSKPDGSGAPEAERPLWRALAQLAVGLTHQARGNSPGAAAVFIRAARELRAWDAGAAPHHIDVEGLAQATEKLAKGQRLQVIRLVAEPD